MFDSVNIYLSNDFYMKSLYVIKDWRLLLEDFQGLKFPEKSFKPT